MKHVGKRIRQFRIMKGLSQQQLADMIHKGRPLISHIENTGKVNHATLVSICSALDVDPEQITSSTEEPFSGWGKKEKSTVLILEAEIEKLRNEIRLKDEIIQLQKAHIRELTGKRKSRKK